jgi:hypothetical protein
MFSFKVKIITIPIIAVKKMLKKYISFVDTNELWFEVTHGVEVFTIFILWIQDILNIVLILNFLNVLIL